eukprot:SAG31_NODE_43729_length_265_cov_28.120482_1_plen_28_part_01
MLDGLEGRPDPYELGGTATGVYSSYSGT